MFTNIVNEIIIKQLGYKKFIAMTGAVFVPTYSGISVLFPKPAKNGIRKINIDYKNDLYDVCFLRLSGEEEIIVIDFKSVLNFELLKLIENHTGLLTSL